MKIRNLALLIPAALILASCEISASIIQPTSSSSSPALSSQETTSSSSQDQPSSTPSSISSESLTPSSISSESLTPSSSSTPSQEGKVAMQRTYVDYSANNIYPVDSAPSVGEAKLLVIPVWFTDSSSYISTSKKDAVREDIQTAYFGSEEETGWHSVKSFYETESQGRLTLSGTVSNWYECGKKMKTFGNDNGTETDALVESSVRWYFTQNPSDSRTNYDADGDGYLDGVMLIYAAPDYNAASNDYDNLWAYCYWLQQPAYNNPASPGPNTYFWASYDFMYDSATARSRAGASKYGNGDCSHCVIDAHTYIHEMGHVFGLDDYYDYGPNSYCFAGGFSMQDFNVGGHDPFSVMALGWANPYIPTESCEITIGAFQSTRDLILLTPSWNDVNSPFDEYLLLELYSPTGLNEFDSRYSYGGSYPKGPAISGIRLWHVDARLLYCNDVVNDEAVFSINQVTTDPCCDSLYGVYHAFSNSYGNSDYGSPLGSSYDSYKLLQLVRNSKTEAIKTDKNLSVSDLFVSGSRFSMSDFSKQFVKGSKLNSGKALGWSFSVDIDGLGEDVTAKVTLTRA